MSDHIDANDIVGLNMGGEKTVQVKRSLLTQFDGSFLASMFSGRWEDQITRDKDGNTFFDEPPEVMMPLVESPRVPRRHAGASSRGTCGGREVPEVLGPHVTPLWL